MSAQNSRAAKTSVKPSGLPASFIAAPITHVDNPLTGVVIGAKIVIRNLHAPANLAGKSHCDTGVGIEISHF